MGCQISDASPHRPALAESLAALSRLGTDYTADDLIPYARLATSTADLDFAQFEEIEDRIALAERAVVLTVLFEPVSGCCGPRRTRTTVAMIAVHAGGASIQRSESPAVHRRHPPLATAARAEVPRV
ncbi:hypothetical protein RB628_25020 [Streptomyces sp. ADMS]|uniref:hypothetical protein n=1 Tax=Streptomyces sp. ADMS TaxID=3071415 RepID=UPI00296FFECE|nr:hypothetical protein [Streptomyces sp. ADMS]MDW4908510.1 hypothetical protein [Streptomyces sp. ADMS]